MISVNVEKTRFAHVTGSLVSVFSCNPPVFLFGFDTNQEPEHLQLLGASNLICVVCKGESQKWKVWDDAQKSFCHVEREPEPILNIIPVANVMAVVLHNQIRMYYIRPTNVELIVKIETGYNPKALCGLSIPTSSDGWTMICPGMKQGEIQIVNQYFAKTPSLIQAHDNELACVSISKSGEYVATASQKGTIVRVYNRSTFALAFQFRRGMFQNDGVFALEFSEDEKQLLCASETGAVHIFDMTPESRVSWSWIVDIGMPSMLSWAPRSALQIRFSHTLPASTKLIFLATNKVLVLMEDKETGNGQDGGFVGTGNTGSNMVGVIDRPRWIHCVATYDKVYKTWGLVRSTLKNAKE